MKRGIVGIGLAALVLVFALPGFSQVGVYVGGLAGVSAQSPSVENVEFTTDTTFLYGVRAGIRVLMLGLEVSYFQAAHNIQVGGGSLIDWSGKVNDYSYLGVNAKLMAKLLFLMPYFTLGYGYYTVDIQSIDRDRDGGFNVGVGLEIKMGRFGLTAEGKYHHVTVDVQNIHLGLGDFTFCGGLNFYF